MPGTTCSDFGEHTEGLVVAEAFADRVRGRTILVTGANTQGIGFSTAEAFASQSPARLIIAGRTLSKVHDSINALKARYPNVDYRLLHLDLSKQQAVRAAAAELLSWSDVPEVDILVNSAGVALLPDRTITEDGIEMHFATNHIGHFLFTNLIMPKILAAAEKSPKGAARVVNVSSLSPTWAYMRWSDTNFEMKSKDLPEQERPNYTIHEAWGLSDVANKSYIPLEAYNQSKVANLLFSIALNKRLYERHGVLALTVHPGYIDTELTRSALPEMQEAIQNVARSRNITYKSLQSGCATSVVAALDPKLGGTSTKDGKENYGVFMIDCQLTNAAHPRAVSSDEAEKLWRLSENLVKEKFYW
ncbi:hypothetical protein S7711_01070 [Stachybotrys chartarum IBT 7711]|uniref:Uncharacterized protein n=1 Tax=Stachybotrys chartarum (strain CBS 109288 / IBT 7711) TaxID=1280523 RepID=A0A084B4C3_STACB|nr:hypothetical protein S7711_01070 [Stachybotrys chartarum IBT 7711]KFA74424.1 hypothetical protein S40288_03976 [Stachybotrys chartarum IBT 40288]